MGGVLLGSDHPIVRQTMTTSDTRDVAKTVAEVRARPRPHSANISVEQLFKTQTPTPTCPGILPPHTLRASHAPLTLPPPRLHSSPSSPPLA